MIKVPSDDDRVLVAKIHEAAQDQVFALWDRLSAEEQASLLSQLHALNLPKLRKLVAQFLQGAQEINEARVLSPAPVLGLPRTDDERAREAQARAAGEDALRQGRIGIVTAAGEAGWGSSADCPRGLCPIGPVSGKSLFCLFAETIRALGKRYRTTLPWIIVASPGNRDAIGAHFREADHFGLNRAEVMFLTQAELPVVNRRGKILLAEPGRLAMSPDGHGGVLLALLRDDETFHSLEVRELEHLFYFQVDNPLVRIADPTFLGYHILQSCDLSSKTVRKKEPEEKVGVFCQFNGTLGVVEHSELSAEDRTRRDGGGQLEFSAANIAVHALSIGFLRRLKEAGIELPCHFVERKTPYIDRKGCRVQPRQPNSIQFASFVFDTLRFARSTLVLEARRDEEFSPVKAETGADSLATARRDLSRRYARWLRAAGAQMDPHRPDVEPIEISPLFALDAEELKEKLPAPPGVVPGFHLR